MLIKVPTERMQEIFCLFDDFFTCSIVFKPRDYLYGKTTIHRPGISLA